MLKALVILFLFLFMVSHSSIAQEIIERIDFRDAAVLDVIKILARRADLDLVINGDNGLVQNQRISLRLKNITAKEAVDHVLKTNGLVYEKEGKTLIVSVLSQTQEIGQIEAIRLKYLAADKISSLLGKVLPTLKASCGGSESTIVLQGKRPEIEEAKKLIAAIDNPVPQILIESKVLEISESDSLRLGFSFGSKAGTFKFITNKDTGQTVPAADLQTTLNALISDGRAKVVATPKIATLDGLEAVINIGSRIPYAVPVTNGSASTQWTVEYIDAGVKLKITPRLGKEGHITTSIQPEVSSISQWRTTAAGDFPVISTRNAQSTLRVKDGETIVVGGLMSEADRENISALPILGQIPVVGLLFQNRTVEKAKTEIVFLITPHVI